MRPEDKEALILQLLPGVFQRAARPGNPLTALLSAMVALQAPDEEVLDNVDRYFDPYRAPDAFVPFLAGWVDLEPLLLESPEEREVTQANPLPSGLGRLRALIAIAAELSRWRGTARGLLQFLQTATGLTGFTITEPKPFYIVVQAPAGSEAYRVLLERIIELEKPAYVQHELQIDAPPDAFEPSST
jgi:phage tail-like protein